MSTPLDPATLLARIPSYLAPSTAVPHPTAAIAVVVHAVNAARGLRLVGNDGTPSSSLPPWNEDHYTLTYASDKTEATFRVRIARMGGRIQVDAMLDVSKSNTRAADVGVCCMRTWRERRSRRCIHAFHNTDDPPAVGHPDCSRSPLTDRQDAPPESFSVLVADTVDPASFPVEVGSNDADASASAPLGFRSRDRWVGERDQKTGQLLPLPLSSAAKRKLQ
jgi:hypothetical protein